MHLEAPIWVQLLALSAVFATFGLLVRSAEAEQNDTAETKMDTTKKQEEETTEKKVTTTKKLPPTFEQLDQIALRMTNIFRAEVEAEAEETKDTTEAETKDTTEKKTHELV